MLVKRERIAKRGEPDFSLKEIAVYFLKLGTIAFGGPAAHIAMMEDETVRRRHWLSREKFLDLLGAANLIPGPSSTELAIYIGYAQAGWVGLVFAGVCFMLPALIIVTALAWVYVQYGSLPQVVSIIYGVKPVVIAIILQALWNLGRSAVKTKYLFVVGARGLLMSVLGINPILTILALMAFVTYELAISALVDMVTIGVAIVSSVLLIRFQVNSTWIIVLRCHWRG